MSGIFCGQDTYDKISNQALANKKMASKRIQYNNEWIHGFP